MKKKVVWLVVTGWMVATLLLASCAPAAVKEEERKVAPAQEKKEEVVVPKTEVVAPKEEANLVKWTGKKLDGTVVEKMIEKPKYGGIHVQAGTTGPSRWDPNFDGGHVSWGLMPTSDPPDDIDFTRGPVGTGDSAALIRYEKPYALVVPLLAQSWELPDDTTVIFHIRQGIRWQLEPTSETSRLVGGREFTAADFVDFYRNSYGKGFLGRSFPYLTDMKNVTNSIYVSPTDKWAVVMKFQPGMVGRQFSAGNERHAQLIPPEVYAKYGPITDWRRVSGTGTGPFILKDYVPESSITYVRNPNYWNHDPFFPENQLPYMDVFKYLIVPDASTRMAGLRSGQIDFITDMKADDVASLLRTNPALKEKWYLGSTPMIQPRLDKPEQPLYNLRVRRALMMAINYQEMVDDYYEGKAVVFASPVAPSPDFADIYIPLEKMPESVRELYGYHPDKARQLLAEAGYPNGFKTEALAYSAEDIDLLAIVKEYWAKIGVDLKIDVSEFSVWNTQRLAGTWKENLMTSRTGSWWMDLLTFRQVGIGFVPGLADPVVVPLYREMGRTFFDHAARVASMTAPLGKVLPDVPEAKGLPNWITYSNEMAWGIVLPSPRRYVLWQPWLKHFDGGFALGRTNAYANYAWIDQALKQAMVR